MWIRENVCICANSVHLDRFSYIFVWKETYVYEKRPIHMKRDRLLRTTKRNVLLSLHAPACVAAMRTAYLGLFSYTQILFHIYGSFFIYVGLFSYMKISFHSGQLFFIYEDLFSYMKISFHIWRSFFIHVYLFLYVKISFHVCRTLSTHLYVSQR